MSRQYLTDFHSVDLGLQTTMTMEKTKGEKTEQMELIIQAKRRERMDLDTFEGKIAFDFLPIIYDVIVISTTIKSTSTMYQT